MVDVSQGRLLDFIPATLLHRRRCFTSISLTSAHNHDASTVFLLHCHLTLPGSDHFLVYKIGHPLRGRRA